MVSSVAWANSRILRTTYMGSFRGDPDFEALLAITFFTGNFAFDATKTLVWPFQEYQMYDYSMVTGVSPVNDCMDIRAKQLLKECTEDITVLCAGDIDSVSVLAALIKNTQNPTKIKVRYTNSGIQRYPKLFQEILPEMGITSENREGNLLVGDIDHPYCDGRTGDDFQAAYQANMLANIRDRINKSSLPAFIKWLSECGSSHESLQNAAIKGLHRFCENAPFKVDTPYALCVALFRFCGSQFDALNGAVTEPNPKHVWAMRRPFYDDPLFNKASAYIAQQGKLPEKDGEALLLREYCLGVFEDKEWFNNERPVAIYYLWRPGYFNTHWLDNNLKAQPYKSFPLK